VTALALAALLVLVALNGVFVAAEFALVRARRGKLEAFVEDGDRAAGRVLRQLDQIDEYLSACQLGITMASIGIGFLGEPALADLIEPALHGFSHAVAAPLAFGLAFAIATSLHITTGEQVPKMMAISRAEGTARRLSRILDMFRTATKPLTIALAAVSNAMLRVVGVRPGDFEETHTSEDLKVLISQSAVGGDLDPGEAVMLRGVFHLHEQEAREVMTPIPAVVTVDFSSQVAKALELCWSSGHNRLVVVEDGNPDRVKGIVHVLRLTRLLMNEGPETPIEPAVREALIVPETKPLDDLLTELQRQRSQMGVVVDEYGRTVGIVTVEDILEEVVGEIEDETDPLAGSLRRLANGDWYVRGHVSLGDLADRGIELPVETDAFNSIGGYVFDQLGRLPKRGDKIDTDGYEIRVESVRQNRIEALRIHPKNAPAEA
jgi:CBS domain containing-hemolysin-like protein